MSEKHTISCLVENHFGVLARISNLISARGFNIDSLTVSATEDPTISRMTIVVDADTTVKLEQVKNQLNRLIDVIEVRELKEGQFIDREILLARVSASGKKRAELEALAASFGAKLAETTDHSVVIEAIGDTKRLDQLVEKLRPHGITKLVRTGRVALEK
ncbi:MAG: acetolactate synthase small subunit [Candidatus Omnitrophica bacterium]|nr:acetolactate synthase small subunit [Candidatus Omnitrophota bacterium]